MNLNSKRILLFFIIAFAILLCCSVVTASDIANNTVKNEYKDSTIVTSQSTGEVKSIKQVEKTRKNIFNGTTSKQSKDMSKQDTTGTVKEEVDILKDDTTISLKESKEILKHDSTNNKEANELDKDSFQYPSALDYDLYLCPINDLMVNDTATISGAVIYLPDNAIVTGDFEVELVINGRTVKVRPGTDGFFRYNYQFKQTGLQTIYAHFHGEAYGLITYDNMLEFTVYDTKRTSFITFNESEINTYQNVLTNLTFKLHDENNKPIVNQSINLTVGYLNDIFFTGDDGTIFVDFNMGIPGEYDIIATYDGNNLYYPSTNSSRLIVHSLNKNNTSILINHISPIVVGNHATITGYVLITGQDVVLPNRPVTVNVGGKNYTAETSPTTGLFTVETDPFTQTGTYPVEVIYEGNYNYNGNSSTSYLTVEGSLIYSNISITLPPVSYEGETVRIPVRLHDANGNLIEGKTIHFYVDGDYQGAFLLETGSITFTLSQMSPGEYNITFKFLGDENYQASESSTTLIVNSLNKLNTTIKLNSVEPVIVGNRAIITGKVANSQNLNVVYIDMPVKVIVNGKEYTAVTDSTTALFTVETDPLTEVGQIPFEVIYEGSYAAEGNTSSGYINVINDKMGTNITFTQPEVIYEGDTPVVYFELHDDNGNVLRDKTISLYMNDQFQGSTVLPNGGGGLTVSGTSAGEVTLKITFEGDDLYKASENSTKVVFNKKIKDNVTVIINEISQVMVGNKAIITGRLTNTEDPNRVYSGLSLTVNVAGKNYDIVTDSQTGHFSLETDPLTEVGTYPVEVTFDGNYRLNGNSSVSSVVVYERVKTNISIIAPISIVAGQSAHLKFILHDDEANPIADKYINIQIGSTQLQGRVDSNGVHEMDTEILNTPGIIVIQASLDEDSYLNGSSNHTSMTINSTNMQHTTVILNNIPDMLIGENPLITGKIIVTGTEQGVGNANMTLMINGVSYEVTTDNTGSFRFDSMTCYLPTEIIVKAIFEDTPYYYGNESETSFRVLREPIATNITIETYSNEVYEEENVSVKFTLHDNDGNPIDNEIITIQLGNITMEVMVNDVGVYETTFIATKNDSSNKMTLSAQKAQEGVYIGSTNSTTLMVHSKQNTFIVLNVLPTALINTPVTISGTLITSSFEYIRGVNVTITVDGIDYVVLTDNSGVFSKEVTFDTPKRANISATFNSTREYYGFTENTTINVYAQKAETNITITGPSSVVQGSEIPLTFYLHDAEGNPIRGLIKLSYNENIIYVNTNTEGLGNYTISPVNQPQIIEITATIESDDVIIGSTNTTRIVVNSTTMKNTTIVLDNMDDVAFGQPTTITGHVQLTSENQNLSNVPVTVVVDGITYNLTTNSGGLFETPSITFETLKTVTITAAYDGNEYYVGNTTTGTFNVIRAEFTPAITLDNINQQTIYDKVNITGQLTDAHSLTSRDIVLNISGYVVTVVTDSSGKFTFEYDCESVGEVTVNAVFNENSQETYLENEARNSTKFNVVKMEFNPKITFDEISQHTFLDKITISGQLSDAYSLNDRDINLTIGSNTVTVKTDSTGKFTYNYTCDTADLITVTAVFNQNSQSTYIENEANKLITFIVLPKNLNTKITLNSIPQQTALDNVTISGQLSDAYSLNNRDIHLSIGSDTVIVKTDETGKFTYNYTCDTIGTITVSVLFGGNTHPNYIEESSYNSTTFDVVKKEYSPVITLDNINHQTVYNKVNITGQLTDAHSLSSRDIVLNISGYVVTVVTDSSGKFTFEYDCESVGEVRVDALFNENSQETYIENEARNSTTFNIVEMEFAPKITLDNINQQTVSDNVTITGQLSDAYSLNDRDIFLSIGSTTVTVQTDSNGIFTYNYTCDTVGTITVTATFNQNNQPTYTEKGASNSTTFEVAKMEFAPTITLDNINQQTIYDNVTITGQLTGAYSLNNRDIVLSIGSTTVTVKTDETGKFAYNYSIDTVGTITVNATYKQNSQETYTEEEANNTTTFNVIRKEYTPTITLDNINQQTIYDNVTITGQLRDAYSLNDRDIILSIGSTTVTVKTDETGKFAYNYTCDTIGEVTVNATFNQNSQETYLENEARTTTTFNVIRKEFTPTITLDNIEQQTVYDNVTITGQLRDAYSLNDRDIILSIGSTTVTVKTDETGKFAYNYTCDTIGEVTVNAKFNENSQETYLENEARNTTTFNVVKMEFSPKISLDTISEQTAFNQVTVSGQLTDAYSVNNRDINLSIGSESVIVKTDENGKFIYNYTCDTVGTITVNAIYKQNSQEIYIENEASNTTTFNVIRKEYTPVITLDNIDQQTVSDKVNITGQLTDAHSLSSRDIVLNISGYVVSVVTDSSGKFTFEYDCESVGEVRVDALFNENSQETYLENEARNSTTFNIVEMEFNPTITLDNINQQTVYDNVTITGQLTGAYSLNDRDIVLSIGSTTVTVQTDVTGKFAYNYTCDTVGTITVTATFNQNNQPTYTEKGASNTTTFEVAKMEFAPTITLDNINQQTVYDNVTITGQLTGAYSLNDRDIVLSIGSNTVTVKTDVTGKFAYNYTCDTVGTITVTATFNQNNQPTYTEKGASNTTTFEVVKMEFAPTITLDTIDQQTIYDNVTITGQLSDAYSLNDRDIILYIGSTTVTVKTDENGIFAYNYTCDTIGKVAVNATFNENSQETYLENEAKNTTTFNVVKKEYTPTITLDTIDQQTIYNNVTITGQLTDAYSLNNRDIVLSIGSTTVTVKTDENGIFAYNYTCDTIGEVAVNATFNENSQETYLENEAKNTTTFNVVRKEYTPTITLDTIDQQTIYNNVTITGQLTDAYSLNNRDIVLSIGSTTVTVKTDENGIFAYNYTCDTIGEVTVNATFNENSQETYLENEARNTTTFNVVKMEFSPKISLDTISEQTAFNQVTISGQLTGAFSVNDRDINLSIGSESVTVQTDSNGKFTYNYTCDTIGEVTVNATFNENSQETYLEKETSNSTTFNVIRKEYTPVITLDYIDQQTRYDNVTITGQLSDAYSLNDRDIILYIGSTSVTVKTDENGIFAYNYTCDTIGEVTVNATFNENSQETYLENEAKNTTTFNVVELEFNPTITLDTIDQQTVYDNVTITGQLTGAYSLNDRDIVLSIGSNTVTVKTDGTGKFAYNYTCATVGTITVTATFNQNNQPTYTEKGASNTTTFEVVKMEFAPTITLDIIDQQTVYDNVTITGQLTGAYSLNDRDIVLSIGSNTVTVKTDGTGKFAYNYTCATVGTITVTATFNQNNQPTYTEKGASNTTTFEVVKMEFAPTITLDTIDQQTVYDNVTITGQLTGAYSLNDRDIVLSIGSNTVTVKTDGTGKFAYNYTCATVGTITVTATFNQNNQPTYTEKGASNTTTFEVVKMEFAPTITLDNINQQTVYDNVTITGQLTGAYSLENRDIQLSVNGKTTTVKTDVNGKFTYNYTCDTVGKVTVIATFNQNSQPTYLEKQATNSISFNVIRKEYTPTITLNNIGQQTSSNKVSITGQLSGAYSLENRDIQLSVNGKTTTVKTDVNGKFTYNYTCDTVGKVTVIATFNQNSQPTYLEKQARNTTTFNVIEPVHNTSITINNINNSIVGSIITVTGTLKDTSANIALSNANVVLTINNKNYNIKTDNTGIYKQIYPTSIIGTNNVTVKYNGNTTHNPSTTTSKFIVENKPTINTQINLKPIDDILIGQITQINGTLKDANGKIISNAKITVLINEKVNTTLTTDTNGNFVYDYMVSNITTNKVKFNYAGNETYKPSTNTTSLTSRKASTIVTVDPLKGIVGNNITFTVHVKDERGNLVSGGNVAIKLNGRTLRNDGKFNSNAPAMKFTVKDGLVTVTIVADKFLRDAKNVSSSYSGSSKYLANDTKNTTTAQIQLRRASLTVTTTPHIQQHYKIITFTAKVDDITQKIKSTPADDKNSYVYFKVNGVTLKDAKGNPVKAKVINGVAQYNYTVPQGMAGISVSGKLRNYSVTAGFYHPDYYPDTKNTTNFNVERSGVNVNVKSATANMKTRKLTITGTITDYMNNNVIGTNKINVKVNGKSLMKNGKAVYVSVTNGAMNIVVDIPNTIGVVKSITLVSGERCAYKEGRTTYTNIKRV